MTLAMLIIRPEGIWLSTDRRITRGGQPEPDAPKQILICCPPVPGDGTRVLLGFAGIAEMPDGTRTLRWIRETIRGEPRYFTELMQHLQSRLTRDVGSHPRFWRAGLALVGGVFESDGSRRLVEISNLQRRPWENPQPRFELRWDTLTGPIFGAIGSGQPYISRTDEALAVRQSKLRPASWEDHAGLLAAINRRTAALSNGTVSPWCDVTYLIAGQDGAISKLYREPSDPPTTNEFNVMLGGHDLTETTDLLIRQFPPGTPVPQDKLDEAMRRQVEGRP